MATPEAKFRITADDDTKRAFTSARKNVQGLDKGLAKIRLGIAAAFGAASIGILAGFVRQSVSAAAAIQDTADKLGLGIEELQEWRFVAEQAGISTETFDMAVQRFGRRVGEAARGGGELKQTLIDMGISTKDATGRTRELNDILPEFLDKVGKVANANERNALAMKGFDSEGVKMVNVAKLGTEAMARLRAEAQAMGAVLSESTVRNAKRASQQLAAMDRVIRTQLTEAMVDLAPAIVAVTGAFASAAKAAADFFGIGAERKLKIQRGLLAQQNELLERQIKLFGDRGGLVTQLRSNIVRTEARIKELEGTMVSVAAGEKIAAAQDKFSRANVSAIQTRFDTLKASLLSEEQALIASYQKRQMDLQLAFDNGLVQDAERKMIEGQLEQQHQDKLEAIRENARKTRRQNDFRVATSILSATSQFFNILAGMSDGASKKEFKKQKKFQKAAALIGTAGAVVNALNTQPFFPVGLAMAALALASGRAQLKTISKTSFDGGGGSPSLPGAGGSQGQELPDLSQQTAPAPQRNITFVLEGEGAPSDAYVRDVLLPMFEKAVDDGATRLTVQSI